MKTRRSVMRAERGYSNIDYMKKNFQFYSSAIELTKYFSDKPRFNGVFSRANLPRIKNRANVINLYDKQSKETHLVSLLIDRNTAVYFDSFGIEYITQKVLKKIKTKTNRSLTSYLGYSLVILSQNI